MTDAATASSSVYVRLRGPSGEHHELGPGAIVGRSREVALALDDPRVSEAHAMVSLRRGQLHLIALRRRFYVAGQPVSEARLRRGLELELARGLAFRVESVQRPKQVVVLDAPALGARVLAGVVTIYGGDPPRLVRRYEADGDAHVWNMGDSWRWRPKGGDATELDVGDGFAVGAAELRLTKVPVAKLGCATTRGATEGQAPLSIVASYDTVELRTPDRPVAHVNGICGRVLTELVAIGGPVSWDVVAREVWPEHDGPKDELRHRWDVTLGRLRKKLREAGVRPELVTTDGAGQVWLVLFEGDTAVDRS